MKHQFYQFMALFLSGTTFLLFSMDNKSKPIKFREITCVPNPCKVAFSANGQLIVGWDDGSKTKEKINPLKNEVPTTLQLKVNPEDKAGICLIDWQQDKIVNSLFKCPTMYPFCFRDHQRTAIALNQSEKVTLYNLDGEQSWECNKEFAVSTFTANGTLYAVQPNGITHNSKNNKTFQLPSEGPYMQFDQLTAHNTQERIFFTQWLSKQQSILYTVDIKNDDITIHSQNMPVISNPSKYGDLPQLTHSPCNDTMAIYWPFGDKWSLYDYINNQYLIEHISNGSCRLLAFHPQNASLLALLTKDGFVELYNTETQTTIARTEDSLGTTTPSNSFNYQMIDVSQDGKYIGIIVGGKCFVLDIDQV